MLTLTQKNKGSLKTIAVFGCLFLIIFSILFYIVNLDFSPSQKKSNFAEASFAGSLDDSFKNKIGATNISEVNYGGWANLFELTSANDTLDGDPDGDGLPNYLEYIYSTNPKKADTDGDGFSDKQEILNGYDPAAPGAAKPKVEISIGKIGITTPMIWSVSEDESIMNEDLKNGVIHFPKTAAPGQTGTMIVSGHSSNYIWAAGNYNHIFKDLNSLESGDIIDIKVIEQNGRIIIYHYKVNSKIIVGANDQKVFAESQNPTLTLATCWPIGTNFERLLVKAELVQ
jgi:LPXTG-site transpeptidase (sortase) family protein